jgi:hypothetical protein
VVATISMENASTDSVAVATGWGRDGLRFFAL